MGRVVSGATGRTLPCCWTECERLGDTRYEMAVQESASKRLVYVFCSERHRLLWLNSHLDLFNLPTGSKSVGGPVQGVDLPPAEPG